MVSDSSHLIQPPLLRYNQTLTVVISGMALGGAQWIVRDWLQRIAKHWRVHLVLLRNRDSEFSVPEGVVVTRFHGKRLLEKLKQLGESLAASDNPVCVAHLLTKDQQDAIEAGGATVTQVFHNARAGWCNQADALDRSKPVIAVSHACRDDLLADGWEGDISVIHHLPRARTFKSDVREHWRRQWKVPTDAKVIGMLGSLKQQKDYVHALKVFRALLDQGHDYYLVILGGIVAPADRAETRKILWYIEKLGLRQRVALPGWVSDGVQCTPAFDLMLNTSHYEGLSVATLEVLAAGTPVVASAVGGQGEVSHQGLHLVAKDAPHAEWVEAILRADSTAGLTPAWSGFPSYRLWTLHHLVKPFTPTDRTLFVTANLNIGGAQRSLVNLVKELDGDRCEVVVTGDSRSDEFTKELMLAGVPLFRSAAERSPFTNAEVLVQHITSTGVGNVVFWNVDAKLKLLLGKALGHTGVRFIDVSPGGYAFESLDNMTAFGQRICYSTEDFYGRLNELVLKFNGETPAGYFGPVSFIPNGIPDTGEAKANYSLSGAPRIAVCGRIAPSKFLLEILAAMDIVRQRYPEAELHVYGYGEETDQEYVGQVLAQASSLNQFHGPDFEAWRKYRHHDAFVVLGRYQGCPNAALEALSVGMPVVANDDGGTGEQVIDGKTGRLTATVEPEEVAAALLSLIDDRDFARTLGQAGRQHVLAQFSMRDMVRYYSSLLWGPGVPQRDADPMDRAV